MQMAAGVGLLKLKNWGRLVAISLQVFGLLNSLLTFGVPANRMKFQQIMDSMMASMNAQGPQTAPIVFSAWIGLIGAIPILLILSFLITQRQAFAAAGQNPAPQV